MAEATSIGITMKYNLLAIFTTLCFGAFAQFNAPQIEEMTLWQNPRAAQVDRELPRSSLISYTSAEGAINNDRQNSSYFQPLVDWKNSGEGTNSHEQEFKIPFDWAGRQVILHLDAVDAAFQVFVNDRFAGYSQRTGVPAEFDITRLGVEGKNRVRVVMFSDHAGAQLETRPFTGELGKDNYIVSQPRVRVRDYVVDTRTEDGAGLFSLGVIVKTHLLNNRDLRVFYDLTTPGGTVVATGHRDANFNLRGEDTVRFFENIADVREWSHEDPYLYTLSVKTQNEGRFMEYLSFKVGFRTVGVDEGKLVVNGKPVTLVWADYQGGSDEEQIFNDLEAKKNAGVNMIIVRGVPQSEFFYRACDFWGLYVCDQAAINTSGSGSELKKGGTISNAPEWENSFTDRVKSMYYHSRNHPSVVMFSIAENSANGYNLYRSYLTLKELEPTRPIAYADAGGEWNSDITAASTYTAGSLSAALGAYAPQPNRVGLNRQVPSVATVKKEEVNIVLIDPQAGTFRLDNLNEVKSLRKVDLQYEVRAGKKLISKGSIPINVTAQQSQDFTINYGTKPIKEGANIKINFTIITPGNRNANNAVVDFQWKR